MANKDAPPPPPAEGAAPPKSKKMLIIAIAAVFLLVILGAGAFLLLKPAPHADDEEAAEVEKPKKKKKKDEKQAAPAYLKMEPYTVNLVAGESSDQYLRLEMTAQFEEAPEAEKAKQYTPSIRNKVLLLLSGKKGTELASKEGKEKLAAEIKDEINKILDPQETDKKGDKKVIEGPVKEILFTEFVIQ